MTETTGGITDKKSATVTVSTSAYASGDLIGGLQSIKAVDDRTIERSGLIQDIGLSDKAKQDAVIDVVFFNANPSNTTFTDNAALTVDDADITKIIGFAQVTSYTDFAASSFGYAGNVAMPYKIDNDDGLLYFALISRGTPTYAATTDVQPSIGLLQD